jgi:hypothetical protein
MLDGTLLLCAWRTGPDRTTLFVVAQEWHGTEHMAGGARTGQVLIAEIAAAGAGWP